MLLDSHQTDKPGWFQEWFDARYYHLLYKDRDEAEARFFLDNLLTFFAFPEEARILDMACGNGRHAAYLAELGYQVVGFDIAKGQISQARHYNMPNLQFYRHDMRAPFQLGNFDVIINLFTSFGYFDDSTDNQKVMSNAAASLSTGGLFVIDFMNIHYILNNLKPNETRYQEGVTFRINRYLEDGFLNKSIEVEDNGKKHHFKEKVRALTLDNFEVLLKAANFTIQQVFGNYALEAYDPAHSERLIIIAEKQDHA